jgi:putative restriction endonuclease
MATARRSWSRDELLQALSLYWRVPFGQLHAQQPDIAALARVLGRTPSSVSMKCCNFASFDPELQARGIKGLQGASRQDEAVFKEFYGRWEVLAEASAGLEAEEAEAGELPAMKTKVSAAKRPPLVTERVGTVKQRIGQRYFRGMVLAGYEGRCCITEISAPRLLRASHIVAWADDAEHRMNPRNGLCLNAIHDMAFDQGLMTLDQGHRVVFAKSLKDVMPKQVHADWFVRYEGKKIRPAERFAPDEVFLEKHRTVRFVG